MEHLRDHLSRTVNLSLECDANDEVRRCRVTPA